MRYDFSVTKTTAPKNKPNPDTLKFGTDFTDNVVVAHHLQSTASLTGFFFGTPAARRDEARFRESAAEILDYLGLQDVKEMQASTLPHGYLRALGIAIGMAARPK